MGGVVDTIGDVVGGAADVVGDVVGSVGDIVGSVADNLNPATIAAIIYMASTGDPSALLAEAGSEEAAAAILTDLGDAGVSDLLANYSPEIGTTFADNVTSSSLLDTLYNPEIGTTFEGVGSDLSNIGSTLTDAAAGAGADVGTGTVGGYTFGADGSIMDAAGNVIADAATSKPLLDAGMSIGDIYNYVKGGMNLANLTGILGKGGSLVGALMPNSQQLGSFFTNLGQAAPLAGAAGLGYLTYKDRANTNKSITDAYNNYLGKQSGIASAYGVGAGPQTLNYNVAGTPLAQAQPRTAAQTVVMPKAAKGGSINDLYSEYSQLNNRMRNYRRLAKGGLI